MNDNAIKAAPLPRPLLDTALPFTSGAFVLSQMRQGRTVSIGPYTLSRSREGGAMELSDEISYVASYPIDPDGVDAAWIGIGTLAATHGIDLAGLALQASEPTPRTPSKPSLARRLGILARRVLVACGVDAMRFT